MNIPETTWH